MTNAATSISDGYVIEPGWYGLTFVPTTTWQPSFVDVMRRYGIKELYLNKARGWHRTPLAFLRDLPDLEAFTILDFTISDISPIQSLHALRSLRISTYCRTPIDFGNFPLLESCLFYWRRKSESLFNRQSLTMLNLQRYSPSDSSVFSSLTGLRDLTIANGGPADIIGLKALKTLESLSLHYLRRLDSLNGLSDLTQLAKLEMEGCKKIRTIDEIQPLSRLRVLHLNNGGEIASLRPLRQLADLEEVSFWESTNVIDGDLSPLLNLPKLRKLAFKDRRHYSHRCEQFAACL